MPEYFAIHRLNDARSDFQECGFSGPVATDQGDPVTFGHSKVCAIDQRISAKGEKNSVKLEKRRGHEGLSIPKQKRTPVAMSGRRPDGQRTARRQGQAFSATISTRATGFVDASAAVAIAAITVMAHGFTDERTGNTADRGTDQSRAGVMADCLANKSTACGANHSTLFGGRAPGNTSQHRNGEYDSR
jgi:hypothetical protein